MYELGKLKREKIELLLNLEDDEVERYILSLSQSYYKAMLEKDAKAMDIVLDSFKLLVETYEDVYPDIHDYINYCLVKSSNQILRRVFDLDCTLWNPIEKSLAPDGVNTLSFSIEKSRIHHMNNAQDIRKMYELVKNDETIDERIVEGISNLYIQTKKYLDVKE